MTGNDSETLLGALRDALGAANVLNGTDAAAAAHGWSRTGTPLALVRPSSTAEVAAVVRICAAQKISITPWGGLTGLTSAACADDAVAISLQRMNKIESIDPVNGCMLVEAGCVLQTAAEAAEAAGMFLPLDLGARGSATIGGVIATNAGGNRVLRFGMMRDLVLGLEAVLADGSVISSLKPLIKNNTGYDLKQLFLGSEGTLGIVTRAVLRLRGAFASRNAAMLALDDFGNVATLLRRLEASLGGQLSAFEAMWPEYYDLVTTPPARGRPILPHGSAFYVLVEAMGGNIETDRRRFEMALEEAMEAGLIADAAIARSEAEIATMWALRDDGEQVGRIGPYVAPDVSLRLSDISPFSVKLRALLQTRWPGTRLVLFGHAGDGNLHVIASVSENTPEMRKLVTGAILELVGEYGGSISAEHGIGLDKRDYLPLSRSPDEIAMMRRIKQALDPENRMNPGKLLPPEIPA